LENDKTDAGRVQTQMYVQIAAAFSALCEPFLPFTATKLSRILKIESPLTWNTISETYLIVAGHQMGEAELLFAN
jgi:methionyl-tRNA synthetase